MIETLEIRPARTSDLDRVAQVWQASGNTGAGDDCRLQMPSVEDLRARIDVELRDGWTLWVATLHGDVCGMLALKKAQRVLDQLFIAPSAQGQGTGKRLLAEAMQQMPEGFTLRTASASIGARAFYEHMGLGLISEGAHPKHGYPVCFYGWGAGVFPTSSHNRHPKPGARG